MISHDGVNRFLRRENYQPKDRFNEAAQSLCLIEVLAWGLKPAFVTGDSWYSCVKNLKTIKNHQTGFMFAVEKNRTVSLEKASGSRFKILRYQTMVWTSGSKILARSGCSGRR